MLVHRFAEYPAAAYEAPVCADQSTVLEQCPALGRGELSPTSATRAKKASNLLILRSWGRRGRHYKVMLWLGHEGGVGGDLGG